MRTLVTDLRDHGLLRGADGWLRRQSKRFFASVETLWEIAFHYESRLEGATTGHVLVHIARFTDDAADRIHAARTGVVPPFDDVRRWPEWPGCERPGAVVIEDIIIALDRMNDEADAVTSEEWAADPAIAQAVLDAIVEMAVHDWDLNIEIEPLPEDEARALLRYVVDELADAAGWPHISFESDDTVATRLTVVDASGVTTSVSGDAEELLKWITGRAEAPKIAADGSELPALPEWVCHREFQSF
ncbi:maleylpyruvate isomerase family mycothiol-dependent enzyme [Arthrobacter sp. SD76]|uniref:maleylpyruvate isomerase family mycothiol-dependent enzyme n=1 Tax=Arthrobacter sp. SD76 TaxID=3415007 RepID=UPI003C790233